MLFHVYCKGDRKPPFGHRAPGHMVRRFHDIWHLVALRPLMISIDLELGARGMGRGSLS